MQQVIIGISGKIGAGKSTFRKRLRVELARRGIRTWWVSFADALKREAIAAGASPSDVYGSEKPPEWRTWLERRGAEARLVNSEHWIFQALSRISSLPPTAVVIVDDLRYRNELYAIIDSGGIAFRLGRGDETNRHPSNTDLDNVDGMVLIHRDDITGAADVVEYLCGR